MKLFRTVIKVIIIYIGLHFIGNIIKLFSYGKNHKMMDLWDLPNLKVIKILDYSITIYGSLEFLITIILLIGILRYSKQIITNINYFRKGI